MALKTAVIGVGSMGRNHARVYAELPNVDFVGIADPTEANAKEIARRFGCTAYADYRTLLDKEKPDAVTIAVPTVDHLAVALEAIQRGIHVLIEKPISFDISDGRQIIAAAEQAGVQLMIGHIERFNPAVQTLKKQLDSGDLGRIFQIDARRQGPFPARIKDVGVVIDLAVHDVDIMRYLSSADPVRVYAETETHLHSTHEDLLSGLIRLDNGIIGTLTINWVTPTKIRELYVIGEAGMYRVDYLTQDLYFFENSSAQGSDWETLRVLRGVSEGRMIRHVVAKKEPLYVELEAFVAAIQGKISVPVSGLDGLKALAIVQAIITSSLENRAISLGELQDADRSPA